MMPTHFPPDVQDMLSLLAKHKVRYLVVGAEAVIYHGFPRLTGDIDIFYEPTEANGDRLFLALREFWKGPVPGIKSSKVLLKKEAVVQFGYPPNRIDLINAISGVGFSEAWKGRSAQIHIVKGKRIRVPYIGLPALIKNKEACGRPKDLEDLKYLKEKANKAKSRARKRS
jgi:hypothetical protein